MDKANAYRSFVYWGERIVTPTGKTNERAVRMRRAWAWAYDSGYYRRLPKDALKADQIVLEAYERKKRR